MIHYEERERERGGWIRSDKIYQDHRGEDGADRSDMIHYEEREREEGGSDLIRYTRTIEGRMVRIDLI